MYPKALSENQEVSEVALGLVHRRDHVIWAGRCSGEWHLSSSPKGTYPTKGKTAITQHQIRGITGFWGKSELCPQPFSPQPWACVSRPPALLPVMPWGTSCVGWLGQQQPLWGSRPDLFPPSPFQAPGSLEPRWFPGRSLAWAGQRERPGPARASEGWDIGKIEALYTKLSWAGAKSQPGVAIESSGPSEGKRTREGHVLSKHTEWISGHIVDRSVKDGALTSILTPALPAGCKGGRDHEPHLLERKLRVRERQPKDTERHRLSCVNPSLSHSVFWSLSQFSFSLSLSDSSSIGKVFPST